MGVTDDKISYQLSKFRKTDYTAENKLSEIIY